MAHVPSQCAATACELETLRGIWAGLPNHAIAARLGCSTKTVDTHRMHLREKLRVHNTAGLIREGLKRGWLDPMA